MKNFWSIAKENTIRSIRKHTMILSFGAITLAMVFSPQAALAGESAADLTQLKQSIAADMTNRETAFTISYTGETKPDKNEIGQIFKQALENDDNLRLCWTKMNYAISDNGSNSDIKFTVSYHTTKEEEAYIDKEAQKITDGLIKPEMSETEKVEAIHKWIISNVSYDYTIQDVTAYTALTEGKTVCMGYSLLMKKMLSNAGVEAKVVTGNIPQGYHAWNMVKIDSQWYYVDLTAAWGAQAKLPKFRTAEQLTGEGYVWDSAGLPQTGTQMF